uniref:Uncharacterized protein n=1 Tax=Arundo donax TaxID=35708 RepID=A0A0A9AS25_ARUDO
MIEENKTDIISNSGNHYTYHEANKSQDQSKRLNRKQTTRLITIQGLALDDTHKGTNKSQSIQVSPTQT